MDQKRASTVLRFSPHYYTRRTSSKRPSRRWPSWRARDRRATGQDHRIGRNYRDHAAELGNTVPAKPLLFLKPPTTVIGDGAAIVLPPESQQVEFEGEIGVVIRTPAPARHRRAGPRRHCGDHLRQ